jgi:hypothetical protein
MRSEAKERVVGVLGIVLVQAVAIHEGFNGQVTLACVVAIVAIVAPKQLDQLPWGG